MSYDNNSDYLFSEDEDDICPLCCEDMDITDKNFKPCPCGYQICQFCYNNIRTNPELNGKCPACRRLYEDKNIEYRNITAEEWKLQKAKIEKKKREKKLLEKERKDAEQAKRHHLAGMRVIQKNLVYVVGLNPPCSYDDLIPLLKSEKYFGQYGKINKIVINKRNPNQVSSFHQSSSNPGYGVYVTFARKEDATRCIAAVDGSISDGKVLKAAYGTTKYCSSYLRGQPCPNPNCMFLHEPGEEADSYSRHDLTSKASSKEKIEDYDFSPQNSPRPQLSQLNSNNSNINLQSGNMFTSKPLPSENEGPALPPTVSWAKVKPQGGSLPSSDPITASLSASAFPSLNDALYQNKTSSQTDLQQQVNQLQKQQQFQLQQLLQKSQQLQKQQQDQQDASNQDEATNNQVHPKKKEKKEKDHQSPVVLDISAISFKGVSDSLKHMDESNFRYSIDDKFKTPEFSISSNIRLFHCLDLGALPNEKKLGLMNEEDKSRLSVLTESLLFSPFTRNYNYRAYLQAANASKIKAAQAQAQAEAEAVALGSPEQLKSTLTPSQIQAQLQHSSSFSSGVNPTQAFLQQRLMQQQQQQQQQKILDPRVSASVSPIPPPPGLHSNIGNDAKSNSQELLSQLMGKKVTV